MRITDNFKTELAKWALTRTSRRLSHATTATALGQQITAPSDDPSGYAAAMRQTDQSAMMQTSSRASRLAADGLALADSTLDAIGELFVQARELATRASNDTLSASDRAAIGAQTSAIREQAIALANTRGSGGFLFGGTLSSTAPFDVAGAFVGNDTATAAPLGSGGPTIRSNGSGAQAFTAAGGRDVFAELQSLTTALNANDVVTIRASTDGLDASFKQIVQEQQRVGLGIERLRSFADLTDTAVVGLESSRARTLGADDLPQLLTELTAAQTAYQRSLEATRRLLALSGSGAGS